MAAPICITPKHLKGYFLYYILIFIYFSKCETIVLSFGYSETDPSSVNSILLLNFPLSTEIVQQYYDIFHDYTTYPIHMF